MGVWIETKIAELLEIKKASHPVWVCGLKLFIVVASRNSSESHPVWVCGLKPEVAQDFCDYYSHTLYGCVD